MAVVPVFNLTPDMTVSRLCLGTMTFGEQNTLNQSFQLLDKAFDSGINFFDSAEMYPVPQRAETQGRSEEYLGRWIRSRKIPRDSVVLATKVSGPSGQMSWIRNGPESVDAQNIVAAIDNSLLRLQSDYIDLYQIHWPDRFVLLALSAQSSTESTFLCLEKLSMILLEVSHLSVLENNLLRWKKQLVLIRYIGLSNETPYGLMKFLHVAEGLSAKSRIVSVQNSYNLLCRNFDAGMAECCHHDGVSLLAYSPLAMGILSGKYLSVDGGPADARLNLFRGRYSEGDSRYNLSNGIVRKATELYISIAKLFEIHPVSLAIAFVLRHPLVASAVFGATKLSQLQDVLNGCNVQLTPEIIAEINRVHSAFPNPCP